MKTLIFALIFSSMAMAQSSNPPEVRLSDSEISNKLISVARDIENQRILEGIPDFERCKTQFAFQANETTEAMRQRAQQATNCFQQALQAKNSVQEITAISDKLNLETYKLIPSKSVQEVTKYLSNKMYKSLTGIDYEETDVRKRIESLKFNKNKKIVDQKQFIILYKNQVAKNALSEVSRFCFEDFRKTGPTTPAIDTSSFYKHWENEFNGTSTFAAATVSDNGKSTPFTGGASSTPSSRQDKDTAYQSIVSSMFPAGTTLPNDQVLSQFFIFCGTQMNTLCAAFENRTDKNGNNVANFASDTATGNANVPVGAKACIAKSRIVALKKALKASDLIIADFNANGGGNAFKLLDNKDELVKLYGSGQDPREKSVNEITNNSSLDFFTATENEDTQRAQNCATNGNAADCDEFVIVDDSRNKIQYTIEIEYAAKRETEIERVKKLRAASDRAPLLEYLKANGYLAAAEDIEKNRPVDLEKVVGQAWEAKKLALQAEIQERLGKRQITQTESAVNEGSTTAKLDNAKQNARETLNERSRLARVIFFNNIISSNLNLRTQSGTDLGRNSQALRGELDSLNGQVAGNLFQNLSDSLPRNTSGGQTRNPSGGESITDITFLDQFLGGPAPAQPGTPPAGTAPGGNQTQPANANITTGGDDDEMPADGN